MLSDARSTAQLSCEEGQVEGGTITGSLMMSSCEAGRRQVDATSYKSCRVLVPVKWCACSGESEEQGIIHC